MDSRKKMSQNEIIKVGPADDRNLPAKPFYMMSHSMEFSKKSGDYELFFMHKYCIKYFSVVYYMCRIEAAFA